MGKLYAISDLHISHKLNHDALHLLTPHPDDSLILAGDIGEKLEHLHTAFALTTRLFKQVFWVPGNHELYTLPKSTSSSTSSTSTSSTSTSTVASDDDPRGERKYQACLAVANDYGVLTPEDEYITWHSDDAADLRALICPLFTLYDYSFRPPEAGATTASALAWALEAGIQATDETLLHPDPYPSREDWCHALTARTEDKLAAALERKHPDTKVVLVNHWPLRRDLVCIPAVPRFSLWCGTTRTEDWHERFAADVVVTGHLHVRRTDWRGRTRFEEVSLGYPRQWEGARERGKGVDEMLREILPGVEADGSEGTTEPLRVGEGTEGAIWRRFG